MARHVERGQGASAWTLPSDSRPQFSQPLRPGTPFAVPQRDDDHRPQFPQPPRPGTPFVVPQRDHGTSYKWGKHLTSIKDPRDFVPLGVIRLTRHKFRGQKPYEDETFKVPDSRTTESLQSLRALIKSTSSKQTLDPTKELKVNEEGKVPFLPEVPECKGNPLSRKPRPPSALHPATAPMPGKVKRSPTMSTVFEELMDIDQSGTRVTATTSGPCAGDASEKLKEDDTVPGPSSADPYSDQRGLVISPHIQGSLQIFPPTHGALGSPPSSQDAQELSLSTQEVLRGPQCDQEATGLYTYAQAPQRPPTCAERKIKHVSSSRRGFISPSSTQAFTNLSSSTPKSFKQGPSDQGGLQHALSDTEGYKPSSPKGGLSDFSFSQNRFSPTTSPQGPLQPSTAAKGGWIDTPHHEYSQECFPYPPKDPNESISAEGILSPACTDQGNFITSPLNQEGFKCPPPLKNGFRSSHTAQRGLSLTTNFQVSLTPPMPAQAETKLSTSIPRPKGPFLSSEGALESSTYTQEGVEPPRSAQGTLGTSQHSHMAQAPSPSSPGVLSPFISVMGTPVLSTSRAEVQRPVLSHKERFKHCPAMKGDPEHSHCGKRRCRDPRSEQGDFTVSLSDQAGFKYPLPAKKALLSHHQAPGFKYPLLAKKPPLSCRWAPNNQTYSKTLQVRHGAQGAETTQPSLLSQGNLALSTSVEKVLGISPYILGIPGYSPPVQSSLGSNLSVQGTVGQDTSTKGPPDTSPSLEMALRCHTSTKNEPGHSPSVYRVLDPTLCDQGSMGCDTCIRESVATFTSRVGDSLDSTCTQAVPGPPHTSQEAGGMFSLLQEYQKSATPTQEAIEPPSCAKRALGSTISKQGALRSSPSTQGCFMHIPSKEANIRYSPSNQVDPRHSMSTKKRLRDDPPDQRDFSISLSEEDTFNLLPNAKRGCASFPAPKETSIATSTPQVSPTSVSVQKSLECFRCDHKTVGPCQSTQGSLGHSISSLEAQRPSLSVAKNLWRSLSAPGLQGHSPFLSRASENSPYDQGALSLSRSKLGTVKPFLSAQECEGKSTYVQRTPGLEPLAQKDLTPPVPSKASKDHSSSCLLAAEHLPSPLGSSVPSTSKQGYLGMSPPGQGSLVHSPSAPGALCCFQSAQGTIELLPFTQGTQDIFPSSSSYSAHLPHLPGDLGLFSLEQGILQNGPPSQGALETSSHTPAQWHQGISSLSQGSIAPAPPAHGSVGHFLCAQEAMEISKSTQGTPGHSLSCLGNQAPLLCSKGTLQPLSSDEVDVGTYSLVPGSAGHLSTVSGFPGSMISDHDSVGNSLSAQGTLRHLPSAQWDVGCSLSAQRALEPSTLKKPSPLKPLEPAQETMINPSSSQGTKGCFQCAQDDVQHLLPTGGALKHPPTHQGMYECLTSDQEALDILPSTSDPGENSLCAMGGLESSPSASLLSNQGPQEHSMSVQSTVASFSSSSGSLEHSTSSSSVKGPAASFQTKLGLLSCMIASEDTSPPVQGTTASFPFPPGTTGYLQHDQRSQQSPLSVSRDLAHLLSNQLCISSQGTLSPLPYTQQSLQHPVSPQEILRPSRSSQCTHTHLSSVPDSLGMSPCVPMTTSTLTLALMTPRLSSQTQPTPAPFPSLQKSDGSFLYTQESLGLNTSAQGSRGPSPFTQEPGQVSLYAKATLDQHTSAQGTEGHSASTSGTLGSNQTVQKELGVCTPAHVPLIISVSPQGTRESSPSVHEVLGPSLSAQGSLKLSAPTKGTVATVPSAQSDVKHPTSLRVATRFPSAQYTVQGSVSSSRDTVPFPSIQESPGSSFASPEDVQHSPSAPCAQEHPLTVPGTPRHLLSSKGPNEFSTAAEGTINVQSSSKTLQRTLEPSVHSSPRGPGSREASSFNKVPRGLSSNYPGDLASLLCAQLLLELSISAQGSLSPSASSKGTIESLSSSTDILGTFQSTQRGHGQMSHVGETLDTSSSPGISTYLPCAPKPLGLSSLEQGNQAPSNCAQGAVVSCLSKRGTIGLSTSIQRTEGHPPSAQGLLSTSSHTQDTAPQYTFAQSIVAHLPSTTVSQEYTHHAQNMVGTLKCAQGSPRISITAQGSLDPLPSPQETKRYSSYATSTCKSSTATPGHVVYDEETLELSISTQAKLSPFIFSQSLWEPSQSVEETLDLSTQAQGTSVSYQQPLESFQSAQRVQQTDQSASDSTRSMPSSKGHLVISSSGQETLGATTSSLRPLVTSLSDQVCAGHLLSSQEAGGPCLSLQETLKVSTCTIDDLRISSSSIGVLGSSPSTPVSLGSSPSSQDVLGTSTSAQGAIKLSPASHLPYAQDNLRLGSPSLGTQGPSQISQGKGSPEYSSFAQGCPETSTTSHKVRGLSYDQGAVAQLPSVPGDGLSPSAQGILQTLPSSHISLETSPSVQRIVDASLDVHHSPGYLRPSQHFPETLQTLSSPKMVSKFSVSSSGTLGTLPLLSASLGHSISAQSAVCPCDSDQPIQKSSIFLQETLQIAPFSKGSGGATPSVPVTLKCLLSGKLSTEMPRSAQGSLDPSPCQKGCLSESLSAQGSLGTSTSTKEYVGHSKPDQWSPQTSTSSQKDHRPSLTQETLAYSSDAGDFGLSQSSEGTLGTSPSIQGARETISSRQGSVESSSCAQRVLNIQAPLERTVDASQLKLETPKILLPPQEVHRNLQSNSRSLENLTSALEALKLSTSAQGDGGPSISDKVTLASPTLPQETLEPSPSDQGSVKYASTQTGPIRSSLTDQGLQGVSFSEIVTPEDSPPQKIYLGNALITQGALGLYTSVQESLGHSSFAQGSAVTSLSSQKTSGTCLYRGLLQQSSSDSGDLGLFQYTQGTLGTLPCTQSTLEIPTSTHGFTEISPHSQDSLGLPLPSVQTLKPLPISPETTETLSSTEEVCKTSESMSGTQETFPSVLGALGLWKSDQCALGHLVPDQGNLGPLASSQEALENSKPAHWPLEPMPSTQEVVGPCFSTEFPRLSVCAPGDLIPIPYHEDCPRHSPYPKINPRLSNSTKNVLRHIPFTEGDIRYSLSELDGLISILSAKGRLTSSTYSPKDSSSTSTPQRCFPPPTSSELSFRSSSLPKEDLRCSPSPQGGSRHSKLKKSILRPASKKAGLKSDPSEDEGLKIHYFSKIGGKASISNKGGIRLKTDPKDLLTTSSSAKGDCRSSRSHEEGCRCSPSPQHIPRHSKSTRTKLEMCPSDKADVHASHSEYESCKQSSLSKCHLRHSSSAKRDQKPKPTFQKNIKLSICTEGDMRTTLSHEENLRHSICPHGTSSLTTSTTTRTRLRDVLYTQEAIKTSPPFQESFNSSKDGDSPNGNVTPSSSPKCDNVRHSVSTKEDFRYTLSVQGGQKTSTSMRSGLRALFPPQWGLICSPVPKGSGTSFPVVQGKFRHTLSQLGDLRSSLSYQGTGTAFQYEYGAPICDPSVLGGHRYSHSISCSLQRITLQKGSWSSNLSPSSQQDHRGLRIANGHPLQGSCKMFQSERKSLRHTPSNKLSLRCSPCDHRGFRDVPSKQEWVQTSTSALGSPQHTPAHGGFRPDKPAKLKF